MIELKNQEQLNNFNGNNAAACAFAQAADVISQKKYWLEFAD